MKKLVLTASLLAVCIPGVFAQKYMTRTGKVIFDATTKKSPEKIDGKNNEVASMLNAETGELVFQVLVKSFKFEKQLMEEHFNENYMESDKFPKSDFKGKIANSKDVNFSKDGIYNTTVAGKLTIHGATNDVSVPGTITVSGNKIKLAAKFAVKLADYKITVPSLVEDKVAKEASIILDAELTQK